MPPDLDLEGKAKPFGTLLLLPLAYRGRPMGCGYVFVRNSRLLPMPYWSELAGALMGASNQGKAGGRWGWGCSPPFAQPL